MSDEDPDFDFVDEVDWAVMGLADDRVILTVAGTSIEISTEEARKIADLLNAASTTVDPVCCKGYCDCE